MSENNLIAEFKTLFPHFAKDMLAFEINNDILSVHLTGDRHYKFTCTENSVSLTAYTIS